MQRAPGNSTEQPIILSMRADPKPFDRIAPDHGQSSIVVPHPCRPEFAHLLEMKRRMSWITHPQSEIFVREFSDLRRQTSQRLTKTWGRRGRHRATLWSAHLPLESAARTRRRADRFAHPPRSADPMLPLRAPSDVPAINETLPEEVSQWLLRFPQSCSPFQVSMTRSIKASIQPTFGETGKYEGLPPSLRSLNGKIMCGFKSKSHSEVYPS